MNVCLFLLDRITNKSTDCTTSTSIKSSVKPIVKNISNTGDKNIVYVKGTKKLVQSNLAIMIKKIFCQGYEEMLIVHISVSLLVGRDQF
jgi:hypothetical protein